MFCSLDVAVSFMLKTDSMSVKNVKLLELLANEYLGLNIN